MTGQGHSHGWACAGIGPPTWEPGPPTGDPGPANLLQTEILLSTPYTPFPPSSSDDPAGEEAGCGDPRLEWLHVVCGSEADWMYSTAKW